jgi:phage portal protein BeeE
MNRFTQALGAAAKSFSVRWSTRGAAGAGASAWAWSSAYRYPDERVDYSAEAGDLWMVSTIAVCLGWIKKNFPEAPLQVLRRVGEAAQPEPEPVPDHPLTTLLARPNPYYSFGDLAAGICLSWFCDGNAYVLKHRRGEGGGPPGALYWEPHWTMRPVRASPREYLSHYVRTLDGQEEILDPADVIHFKNGLDPRNDLCGMSELKACLPEAVADGRWARYTARLARFGAPSVILAPRDKDLDFDPGVAARIKAQYMARTTADHAGEPVVLGYGVEMHRPALTPAEMGVGELRQYPQDTLIAAFGLNAMSVNLTSGAAHKTYANYEESRKAAYQDCLMPLQRDLCEDWRWQLLVDFEADVRRFTVAHDYGQVAALQEDKDALYRRTVLAWRARAIDRAETRVALGFEARPEDEGLYWGAEAAPAGKPLWVADDQGLPPEEEPPEVGPAAPGPAQGSPAPLAAGANGNGKPPGNRQAPVLSPER